jgi:colanic acid/amylovoran biosynthesis glycosyltransferase
VGSVPFKERSLKEGETIHMATVGRFVEKKGFDDLLRSLAILKQKISRKFLCHIIGGGELDGELRALAKKLDVEDVVEWKGYMKLEDIEQYLLTMHFYVQPSKTASNGDME